MNESSKKEGFLGRVLAKLTGGDEAKVKRFQAKAVKSYTSQINIRKNEIDDLKEKKNDLEEKFEETAISVDLDAIKSVDSLDSYIIKYTNSLTAVQDEIAEVEEEIAEKEAEIAKFQGLIDVLK